MKSGVANI